MANKNTQPEEVQATQTDRFLAKNGKVVIYAIIAVIVVIAVIVGVNKCSESRNDEAMKSEVYMQAQFDFEAGQYEAALENFETLVNEYSSTQVGNMAKAYAGLCKKNLGDMDGAIEYLKQYDGQDDVVAPAILSALGDCYVESEAPDYKAAAKAFEKAAAKANCSEFSPLYLRKAGLAYEAMGDKASALKAYQSIKDQWPDSEQAAGIDKYVIRVK